MLFIEIELALGNDKMKDSLLDLPANICSKNKVIFGLEWLL